MGLALVSLSGFILRWIWMMNGSPLFGHRLNRLFPHIVDTLFLTSGIWLAFTVHQYPFTDAWLTAKIFGLVVYIILGSLALEKAPTGQLKVVAFMAAIVMFGWIVSVARLKTAWGFLSFMN